jgi:hypothetical protein
MKQDDLKASRSEAARPGPRNRAGDITPLCVNNSTKNQNLVNPVSPGFNNTPNSFNQINPGLPSFTDARGFYRAGTAGAWHAWECQDPAEMELAGSVIVKAANAIRASRGNNA